MQPGPWIVAVHDLPHKARKIKICQPIENAGYYGRSI
jgi:hypothetical protein